MMTHAILIAALRILAAIAPVGSVASQLPPVDLKLDPSQITLKFDVYRVRGDLAGQTSLTENIWESIPEQEFSVARGALAFFTTASLHCAGVKLNATPERWSWDGQEQPPDSSRIETIAAPRVVVLPGNPFEISLGSQQPVEYFVRRPDGLFELKRLDEPTGLSLAGQIERLDSGRLLLKGLEIELRSIESREPIAGVGLDVGKPVVNVRQVQASLSILPGRYYGMQLITEGYGFLLIRLRAETRAETP